MTASTTEEGVADSSLNGADVTLRMSADSWLRVQAAKSEGAASSSLYSNDGGFDFVSDGAMSFDEASSDARLNERLDFGRYRRGRRAHEALVDVGTDL